MIFDAIALATKSKKITQKILDDDHYLPLGSRASLPDVEKLIA